MALRVASGPKDMPAHRLHAQVKVRGGGARMGRSQAIV